MNKRIKKKKCKDCSSCKFFDEWDNFSGQYGEYGRCELEPCFYPICSKMDDVFDTYPSLDSGYFPEEIQELTGKMVCKFWKRK